MRKLFNDFIDRYFHDEESIILVFLLTVGLAVFLFFGSILTPLIAALIIAYLMQGLVALLLKYGFTERLAFGVVYILFFGIFITMLGFLLPQVWNQLRRMMDELPNLLSQGQELLLNLPEIYPSLFSEEQVSEFMDGFAIRYSAIVERDLVAFFNHWEYPMSDDAATTIQSFGYETWLPEGW